MVNAKVTSVTNAAISLSQFKMFLEETDHGDKWSYWKLLLNVASRNGSLDIPVTTICT